MRSLIDCDAWDGIPLRTRPLSKRPQLWASRATESVSNDVALVKVSGLEMMVLGALRFWSNRKA